MHAGKGAEFVKCLRALAMSGRVHTTPGHRSARGGPVRRRNRYPFRLMLGTAISRGGGTGTPWALSQPKTVSVRRTRAGLCRVSTRLSFGGGGTGSKASALNVREHDMHRRKPTLSGRAALCHDWQCGHLRRGASLTPSAVVTDSEVFTMSLPFVKRALHQKDACFIALSRVQYAKQYRIIVNSGNKKTLRS